MIEKIVQWKSEDGQVFDTQEQAERYQEVLGRLDLIQNNMEVDGGYVSVADVLEFIEKYTKGWK